MPGAPPLWKGACPAIGDLVESEPESRSDGSVRRNPIGSFLDDLMDHEHRAESALKAKVLYWSSWRDLAARGDASVANAEPMGCSS